MFQLYLEELYLTAQQLHESNSCTLVMYQKLVGEVSAIKRQYIHQLNSVELKLLLFFALMVEQIHPVDI